MNPSYFSTPGGSHFSLMVRGDTNDGALAYGILSTDEYALIGGPPLTGWALDIGAHIGTVGVALAIDHPELRVICVEPVPDNCDLIRESVRLNGLADRVFVEEAAAGSVGQLTVPVHYAYTRVEIPDKGYVEQNRFIGNLWRHGVDTDGTVVNAPVVTIASLMDKYGIDDFRFCKTDAEGAEWEFFRDGAKPIAEIKGEWHDGPFSRIERLLAKTHDVSLVTDYGGSGIFHAVRR